jgi:hypothetical protein
MPKRGRKNAAEAAAESTKKCVALRRQRSAVERDIAAREHHGLDRCLDVGLPAYRRYVGYGVLAFNLHQIGRELLGQQRRRVELQAAAGAGAAGASERGLNRRTLPVNEVSIATAGEKSQKEGTLNSPDRSASKLRSTWHLPKTKIAGFLPGTI